MVLNCRRRHGPVDESTSGKRDVMKRNCGKIKIQTTRQQETSLHSSL